MWNGLVDRRPGAIAYCTSVADIAACVRFARERELLTAVRSGGHACAGTAVCDGGLVIDTSRMRAVTVDPASKIARAEAGARWREVDRATQTYDLATVGGTDSEVGIAGLTLGGGNGWLMGIHGATCDNVVAIDVVTADARMLRATADENPDLFWAMRGGGGNFGVATGFEYRLFPVGPTVMAGMVTYPYAQARQVLEFFREFSMIAPDELTVYACLICTGSGAPAIGLAACYVGPMNRAEAVVAPLRKCGTPIDDALRPMPYLELQTMMDAARPAGALRDALAFHGRTPRRRARGDRRTFRAHAVAAVGRDHRASSRSHRARRAWRNRFRTARKPVSLRDNRLLGGSADGRGES